MSALPKAKRAEIVKVQRRLIETVQKLLLLGSALEKDHVAQSVARLAEPRQRELLLALYRDRLDYPSVRAELGVGAKEIEGLHQVALAALVECLGSPLPSEQ